MMTRIPYSPWREDLYHPCKNARFFSDGLPRAREALCAELARLVYCPFEVDNTNEQKVRTILQGVGFENTQFFSGAGTQGFLTRSQAQRLSVLVFRGTESQEFTDLATDAQAWLINWERGGKVHRGFAEALQPVWPTVQGLLEHCESTLVYTGHSLGAALATVAASKEPPMELYTFGSPLVGDEDFTRTLNNVVCFRYVDCCDLVTRIPPEVCGYMHVGKFHYINQEGQVHVNPNTAFVVADRMQAREAYIMKYAWKIGTVGVRDLADHAPINYVSGIVGRVQESSSGDGHGLDHHIT